MQIVLTPELLLAAYKEGLFPMAYGGDSPYVHWVCPEERGQLSITNMHISKSLQKLVRKNLKDNMLLIRIDQDFEGVIRACAEETNTRPETWINQQIIDAFCALHKLGHAHSVEVWQNGALVGGLYGLAIGGAFCGESMFSRVSNASKIALVHLAARLYNGGFTLLDTQFTNEHLEQFGVYEVQHTDYKKRLDTAVKTNTDFVLEGVSDREILEAYFDMRSIAHQTPKLTHV